MSARKPAHERSLLSRAEKLRSKGQAAEAERLVREHLEKRAQDAHAWTLLGKLLAARKEPRLAQEAYERAVAVDPGSFDARVNLGLLLAERGQREAALEHYRQALAQRPDHPLALRNYGALLRSAGSLLEARSVLLRALRLSPQDAAVHNNLGLVLSSLGRVEEAQDSLARAVQLAPDTLLYHDNMLMLSHYAEGRSPAQIAELHLRYGALLERRITKLPARPLAPTQGRRLRVGYVSADLRRHSVAFFLAPLWEHRDRERFELYAYSNVVQGDQVTERLKALCDVWRDVTALDDAALARQVRADQLDVLVDLSGHTQGNRLPAFAYQPAPVQVTYLGYPNTTGLKAVGYRISDGWADPEESAEALHAEQLLRMPSGFLCYEPPQPSPAVEPAPSSRGAPPTFGSFNALTKMSSPLLDLWSQLLRETPEARLVIKQSFLSHPDSRRSFEERLTEHGFDLSRVTLLGHVGDLHGHLAAYGQVDVALDTFPYHGTTTSCDALYMGVPLVTLAGEAHVSRVGVSLLARLGLSDLVASTREQYLHIARTLLRDEARRTELRQELRARMAHSGLLDGARMARELEALLVHACEQNGPPLDTAAEQPERATSLAQHEPPLPDPDSSWLTTSAGQHMAAPRGLQQITSYVLREQGDWFEDEIQLVRTLLSPGEQALDVGANHGVYALSMARAVGPSGRVVAVEPARVVAERARASARRNGFTQLEVACVAISNKEGRAQLFTGDSSELSSLSRAAAGGAGKGSEEVRLTTLDTLASEHQLTRVAFVKLDVEGEEVRALEGALGLLQRDEPLLMVERKHGERENVGLLEWLTAHGHALYRYLPGLGVLYPHPLGTDADPFLLNVFAATPARAAALEQRGLLARFLEDDSPLPEASWQEALSATRLGHRADLARGFQQETAGKLRHQAALARFALAQRADLSASQRALALRSGLSLALSAVEDPRDLSRLMTVARLAWAWGRRMMALEALNTALTIVNRGGARIDEPFLPPCPRYDGLEPEARLSDWAVSALLEQFERLRNFSGFFDKSPKEALGRLTLLAKLGFQSPEMARRLALVQQR